MYFFETLPSVRRISTNYEARRAQRDERTTTKQKLSRLATNAEKLLTLTALIVRREFLRVTQLLPLLCHTSDTAANSADP